MNELPACLTVEEAARVLRVGRTAAYAAVKAGDIPCIKVGRSIRVPRHKLEHMLGLSNDNEPAGGELEVTDPPEDDGYAKPHQS